MKKTNHLFIKLIKILLQVQITLNIYLHTEYLVKTNTYIDNHSRVISH